MIAIHIYCFKMEVERALLKTEEKENFIMANIGRIIRTFRKQRNMTMKRSGGGGGYLVFLFIPD